MCMGPDWIDLVQVDIIMVWTVDLVGITIEVCKAPQNLGLQRMGIPLTANAEIVYIAHSYKHSTCSLHDYRLLTH